MHRKMKEADKTIQKQNAKREREREKTGVKSETRVVPASCD